MTGLGTAINVATVVAGTGVGVLVGNRLPEQMRSTLLTAVGLVTLVLGVSQGLATRNLVFPLVAVVLGGLTGELLAIEDRLHRLGERIRRRVERRADAEVEGAVHVATSPEGPLDAVTQPATQDGDRRPSTFVEGFVAASLVFCIGPLAILGSLQDALSGDIQLLAVKAALDGLVAAVFASTLGVGVGFSAISVLLYQGTLTALAGTVDRVLTERMIAEATATGGVMVLGISLRLLDLRQVRVGSLLPGLVIAPVAVALFAR